ncbi:DUF1801 domain-containing protein [Thalassotalea crassostreae]|uniref:DUF1801 domain-containing protein n=1 Tax=Thalassotalea crassostreae TaxID=1763536 RepID=UPI0008380056|nr:DUF1801 domain-containing protein [Thalassotalea crassostreae]
MAENKTQITNVDVDDFIASVEHSQKQSDAKDLNVIFSEITGHRAKMWGAAIIGYGEYHYKYDSGREGDFLMTGFSPRKQNISLYIMMGFSKFDDLLSKLGKHKLGKSCLYINKLADIDEKILKEIIRLSFEQMKEKYN